MKKSEENSRKKYALLKKNYILRLAGVLLLACVLLIAAMSSIAARYSADTMFAAQSVRVAAFNVLVNGKPIQNVGDTLIVDLFDMLYSSVDNLGKNDTMMQLQSADSAQTANPAGRAPIIAPGNGGKFTVSVRNLSEVPIRFMVSVEELINTAGIPIEFRAWDSDAAEWSAWSTAGAKPSISSRGDLDPTESLISTVVFEWRWKHVDGASTDLITNPRNMLDTGLGVTEREATKDDAAGKLGSQTLTVKLKAVAAQID